MTVNVKNRSTTSLVVPPSVRTLKQRRLIDVRLAEGLADIKAGRTFGPFDSADEMIADMKAQLLEESGAAPKAKRRR